MAYSSSIYPLKSTDFIHADCIALYLVGFSGGYLPDYLGTVLPTRSFHVLLYDELGLVYRFY